MPMRMIQIALIAASMTSTGTWAAFPEVTRAVQLKRDVMRREILTAELDAEKSAWTTARIALAAESTDARREDLHRHTQNVQALRRELEALSVGNVSPLLISARASRTSSIAPETTKHKAPYWDPYRRTVAPSRPTAESSAETISSTIAKEIP